MNKIEELRNYLLENYVNEYGDLVLSNLDFSEFAGDVHMHCMKVQGSLRQHNHKVQGDLIQSYQEVQGDLVQSSQKVQGDLYNGNNKYGGDLYEMPSTKLLKEITLEELSELGYKLKGE